MHRLEVSCEVRYIYVVRRQRVKHPSALRYEKFWKILLVSKFKKKKIHVPRLQSLYASYFVHSTEGVEEIDYIVPGSVYKGIGSPRE